MCNYCNLVVFFKRKKTMGNILSKLYITKVNSQLLLFKTRVCITLNFLICSVSIRYWSKNKETRKKNLALFHDEKNEIINKDELLAISHHWSKMYDKQNRVSSRAAGMMVRLVVLTKEWKCYLTCNFWNLKPLMILKTNKLTARLKSTTEPTK